MFLTFSHAFWENFGICGNQNLFLDQIERIPVEQLAAPRSFVWLWCGSIEGLSKGREVCFLNLSACFLNYLFVKVVTFLVP